MKDSLISIFICAHAAEHIKFFFEVQTHRRYQGNGQTTYRMPTIIF